MTSDIRSQNLWNRWVTTKPIIPILFQSRNGPIFLRCLTEQEIIQQSMKEIQNANMSFAFFGLGAQGCTLQGLFTYGFGEVCLNKQFESWGSAQPGDHSEMRGKLAVLQLVNRHFSWAWKQLWSDSSWSVLAHTSFYQDAASLRCKFHSDQSISGAIQPMSSMWWSRIQCLDSWRRERATWWHCISQPLFPALVRNSRM